MARKSCVVPKQLSVWNVPGVPSKQRFFKKSRKGQKQRLKIQKELLSANEKLVYRLRCELKDTKTIAKSIGIDHRTVRNHLVKVFKEDDPFYKHILESFNNGESTIGIAKRLGTTASIVGRCLKVKYKIEVWDEFKERTKESARNIRKIRLTKIAGSKQELANDLYCMWKEIQSIRDVVMESGYGETAINNHLLMVPDYKEKSWSRRAESAYNRRSRNWGILSKKFKKEKDFQDVCLNLLKSDYVVARNVNGFCCIEVDLLVEKSECDVLIELKITSRKVIEAQALGQALITKTSYARKRSHAVICFPDDCKCSPGFSSIAKELGVIVCSQCDLKQVIDGLK